jgi:hypothetical protein
MPCAPTASLAIFKKQSLATSLHHYQDDTDVTQHIKMNLVGYSDSEGSDEETAPAPPPKPKPVPPKSFAKLVNPSTHKVKVNLAASTTDKNDIEKEEPPAKKARVEGGGLNINAFLPAPKKTAQQKKGLGRGVNLKTGAEPAFSRDPPPQSYDEDKEDSKQALETNNEPEPPKPVQAEVKLVGNTRRFMPLSVAKNAKKKKALAASAAAKATPTAAAAEPAKAPPLKPKVSLFSLGATDTPAIKSTTSTSEYTPMMLEEEQLEEDDEVFEESYTEQQQVVPSTTSNPAQQSINSLTSDLNLSEADMRQLFGRKAGKRGRDMPDLAGINVVNFNTDAEYAANNEIIAKGETVTHNPVRGIAPGKHSLKQLMNVATTQKEALEEHFAKGKRNQGDARARYGW